MYFVVVANDNSTNCFKFCPNIISQKDYFGNPPNTYLQELIKNDQFLDNTEKNAVKKPHLLNVWMIFMALFINIISSLSLNFSSFLRCQVLNFLSLTYIFVLCIKQ